MRRQSGVLCKSVWRRSMTDACVCICTVWNSQMLTQLSLPKASRQFDQEGRKKFFTLDMNNILLEWVGRHLNPSAFLLPLSLFFIFSRFSSPPLLLSFKCFVFSPSFVVFNDLLLISLPLPCSFNLMFTKRYSSSNLPPHFHFVTLHHIMFFSPFQTPPP